MYDQLTNDSQGYRHMVSSLYAASSRRLKKHSRDCLFDFQAANILL